MRQRQRVSVRGSRCHCHAHKVRVGVYRVSRTLLQVGLAVLAGKAMPAKGNTLRRLGFCRALILRGWAT